MRTLSPVSVSRSGVSGQRSTIFQWLRAAGLVGLCATIVAFNPAAKASDASAVSESKARALFLANFVKYVDWPVAALGSTNAPVLIGLVGKCDLEDELKTLAKTTVVAGHPLIVRTLEAGQEIKLCHILFIPAGEIKTLGSILERLQRTATLTVSDAEKFAPVGGMIALVRRESRIRPQINLTVSMHFGHDWPMLVPTNGIQACLAEVDVRTGFVRLFR